MSLEVHVKQEPLWEDNRGCYVSEQARASLYADHEIKGELVLGPEVVQPSAAVLTDLVHIKKEVDYLKEEPRGLKEELKSIKEGPNTLTKEPVWENSTSLHVSEGTTFDTHNVKDELVLSPNCNVPSHVKLNSASTSSGHQPDDPTDAIPGQEPTKPPEFPLNAPALCKRKKTYICKICEKEFTKMSSLKRHELIHTGEKLYSCDICRRKFTRLNHLEDHKLTHWGIKPYSCGKCEKKFTQLSNLKRHQRSHDGIKDYTCEKCKKAFTLLSHLNDHKLTHLGVKAHLCDICEKGFTLMSDLKRHKQIHERAS